MRKKYFVFVLMLAILLTAVLPPMTAARAADDDFSLASALFDPGALGANGGNTRLILRVANEGATNITRVTTVVNLKQAFSKSWGGVIAPGEEKKIVFENVLFAPEDMNVERILQLGINNDMDKNPDGVQMKPFTMEAIPDLMQAFIELSPNVDVLHPGETFTGTVRFRNTGAESYMVAEGLTADVYIDTNGSGVRELPAEDHGSVGPGGTAVQSFRYTPTQEDVTDSLTVGCKWRYTYAGAAYRKEDRVTQYAVEEIPDESVQGGEAADDSGAAESGQEASAPAVTQTPAAATPTPNPTPTATPAQAAAAQPGTPDALLPVIVTALAAAVVILIILLARRKKKGEG